MASLLAQLPGPINLRLVLSDTKFADILHDLVTAKGNRFGVPRVLAVDRNETRELAGTLHIEGANKDNAIAQIRAINALVTVGSTTLTLKSRDATNSVTLNILPSRGVSQPLDELFELPGAHVLASCPFSFTCEPYAYGPAVVIFNEIVVAPCLLDLGTVPGDYPAPLDMQFLTNSTGFHAIYCGLQRPGSADDIGSYKRQAEEMYWTGGATTIADKASANGGRVVWNNSTDYARGGMFDDVSPGTYMLLTRLYVDGAGNCGYVKETLTGQFAYPDSDAFDLYEMGSAHLPAQRMYAGQQVSQHDVMMSSGIAGGGNIVALDYAAFVPTSWGYWRWHPAERGAWATKLNVIGDGGVYEGDIGSLANFRGAPVSCVGPSKLVLFAEDAQQAQGCQLNLSVAVTPRYTLWA